jgi:lambda family phage portal protein
VTGARAARTMAAAISPRLSIWQRIGKALIGSLGRGSQLGASAPYKAAAPSRANADWTMTSSGPNTTVAQSRSALVARSRDMKRNDPHATRIVNTWVNNIVGVGIPPRAKHDGTPQGIALAAQADALWARVAKKGVLDLSGQLTAAGQQRMECAALITDGEVYSRRVFDPTAEIGIRVEVLECDMIDESLSGQVAENGNRIIQGIEVNARGRRVACWIRSSHPGEVSLAPVSARSIRVPIEDIICQELPGRPGQVRSVPLLAPVMMTKKNLGDFEDFTLVQKKTEACMVGVVKRAPFSEWNPAPEPTAPSGDSDEPDPLVGGVIDADGNRIGTMRPGSFVGLDYGEDIVFNQTQLASNYGEFKKTHLQSTAVGVGMSYEQISGDFSGANYSTMRGGLLEFWTGVNVRQNDFIAAQEQKWRWVMEAGWLKGLIDSYEVEAEWQVPGRQSIEPDKDAIADTILVRNGWIDEDDVIAGHGYHPESLRAKIQQNRKAREKYGIVSDADPTKQSWRGSTPNNQAPLAGGASDTPQGGS